MFSRLLACLQKRAVGYAVACMSVMPCVLVMPTVAAAQSAAQQTYRFDIPEKPLSRALIDFNLITRQQVGADAAVIQDLDSAPVQGTMTARDALERMIEGTSIELVVVNGNNFVLRAAAEPLGSSIPLSQRPIEEIVVFGKDFVADLNRSGTKTDTPLIETAQSISIISRDLLDSWNANKLTEALRYTPGVAAEPFGIEPRFTSLRMRGFNANTTAYFRDGLVLSNPGFYVYYNLEPYGAERIEIPRGPASVLYGQGSPGGIVNYISKMPTARPFGEAVVQVANHDRVQGQFDLGGPLDRAESVSYRLTGLVRDGETQIDFVPDDRTFVAPAITWKIGDATSLTFLASYQDDSTGSSQGLPADGTLLPNPGGRLPIGRNLGEPDVDKVERTEYSFGYQLEHEFNDTVTFSQNARFNDAELDYVIVFTNGLEDDLRTMARRVFGNRADLEGLTIDNQLHLSFVSGAYGNVEHSLLIGLDYQGIQANSFRQIGAAPSLDVFEPEYGAPIVFPDPFLDSQIELDQLGVYVQDEIKFAERIVVNLAARYDFTSSQTFSRLSDSTIADQDDEELTLRAGVVYLFDNGLAPYAGYAESFLPSAGTDEFGNAFNPETARQYEVGLKYEPAGFDGVFTMAFFDIQRDNFVARDQNFVDFQTGRATSRGIELEAFATLVNGLSIIANYNYLDTEIKDHPNPDFVGKSTPQIPEHKASIWLDYDLQQGPLSGLGFGFGVRYQSSTFSDDLNTVENPSISLVDAALYYQWDAFKLSINVQNLEDDEHTAACFQRASLLCSFGETRSIQAALKYRW